MATRSRRLAAVMFTDLVGFTRLGQRDEETALRLRREHQTLVRPLFAGHGGREVKSLGDGFLVEFPSAVDSVRCAVAVQEAIARRNAAAPADEPIVLRIGIHLGDVVGDGDDIVGDAVNVASRLQPLADPGGICISGAVFEQVRNKVTAPFESIGVRPLKNVEQPVTLYRVVVGRRSAPPARGEAAPSPNLRLAILPLANLSPDANDEFFADGLTDELISHVARIPSVRVIARTSVLRYKSSPKSIRDVASDLGVQLALEGSVRKAGHQVRIAVKLIDAASEEPLWSSRYDRPLDDIFSIQDDIAGQIASSISGHLAERGATTVVPFVRAPTETANLDAYSQFLHGRKLFAEKRSEATIREALGFFEGAARADPKFARAHVGIAEAVLWLAGEGAFPFSEAEPRARDEIATALGLNERLAEAHSALAGVLLGADDPEGAEREARRASELNPSLTDPYRWLAQLTAGRGAIDEAIRFLETAQQIDPVDVNILAFLGRAYYYAGRPAEAIAHWERTKSLVEFRTNAHLTEFYLARREFANAERTLREMERLRPTSVWVTTYRGMLAASQGHPDVARACIEQLRARLAAGEATAFQIGFVHHALGERDAFVAALEESFRMHSLPLLELMYSPLYESARDDPRVQDLLRRQDAFRSKPP